MENEALGFSIFPVELKIMACLVHVFDNCSWETVLKNIENTILVGVL